MSELSGGILTVSVTPAIAVTAAAFTSGTAQSAAGNAFVDSSSTRRAEIWAVGDGADGSPESYAVARMIARSDPDRFLYLGDVYPTGTAADFATRYEPTYGRLASITAPTVGNHEAANREVGYDPYWRKVKGRRLPHHYAFDAGGWRITFLRAQVVFNLREESKLAVPAAFNCLQ